MSSSIQQIAYEFSRSSTVTTTTLFYAILLYKRRNCGTSRRHVSQRCLRNLDMECLLLLNNKPTMCVASYNWSIIANFHVQPAFSVTVRVAPSVFCSDV